MPITLTAVQCPPIVVPTGVYDVTTGGITSKNLATGDTSALRTKVNENAGRTDLVARYGGGSYGVCTGLDLSAGSGLTLNIAAGVAMIDGIVEFTSAQTLSLTDGGRNHIWLRRTGALTKVFASLTPPGTDYCYIGSAVTAAGSITSVDQSGIVYLMLGGLAKRRTADASTPGDTPPATMQFVTEGSGGKAWLWTGAQYLDITTIASPLPVASGGTGATTAAAARANLSVGREGQVVKTVNANVTLSADDSTYSQIELAQGSIAAAFTATFPSAATMISGGTVAGHLWTIRNDCNFSARIVMPLGNTWFLPEQAQGCYYFDGSDIWEVGQVYPRYGVVILSAGNWNPSTFDEQLKSLIEIDSSGAPRTANFVGDAGLQRGRQINVRSDDSSTTMLTVKTAGAAADREALLLPGESQPFVVMGDGSLLITPTRPYERRLVVSFSSDANKTLAHPDYLAVALDVISGVPLTTTRDLISPLCDSKQWTIRNATTGGQSIRVIGASGTGVVIRNGKSARVRCDGTNFILDEERAVTTASSEEVLATTTGTATVANTTTPTSLLGTTIGSFTLPAAVLQPGRTVRLEAWGYLSSSGGPNLTIDTKLGATSVGSTGAVAQTGTPTNAGWHLELLLTCRTTGASGTVIAQGMFRYNGGNFMPITATATTTIDTTGTLALDIVATWGTAAAGNTISCSNVAAELLN